MASASLVREAAVEVGQLQLAFNGLFIAVAVLSAPLLELVGAFARQGAVVYLTLYKSAEQRIIDLLCPRRYTG
jgi:hypothetical protein